VQLRKADSPSKESYQLSVRLVISEVNSELEQARKQNMPLLRKTILLMTFLHLRFLYPLGQIWLVSGSLQKKRVSSFQSIANGIESILFKKNTSWPNRLEIKDKTALPLYTLTYVLNATLFTIT
jgi:hypothetical protein